MPDVILYTKPGCHLCDQAAELLAALAVEYPHRLTRVNIEEDAALFAVYAMRIPVIRVGATEIAAPISQFRLRRAFAREAI